MRTKIKQNRKQREREAFLLWRVPLKENKYSDYGLHIFKRYIVCM